MDADLLKVFAAVVDCRGFTQAAQALSMTQSTVSAKIKRLEEQAGCLLLARTTRGMDVTPDGEAMLGYARGVLAAESRAQSYFAGRLRERRIKLGIAPELAAGNRLAGVIQEFVGHFPEVALTVSTVQAVTQNELKPRVLDLAVTARVSHDSRDQLLWSEPLVWVTAAGFDSLRAPSRLVLAALAPLPLYWDHALAVLRERQQEWVVRYSFAELSSLRDIVASGLAITALPLSLVEHGLAPVPDGVLPPLGKVGFVLQTRRGLDDAGRVLADLLEDMTPSAWHQFRTQLPEPPNARRFDNSYRPASMAQPSVQPNMRALPPPSPAPGQAR